jgi:hypothetical protein
VDRGNEEPQQAAAYAASPSPEMEGAKAPSCPVTPEKVTPPAVPETKVEFEFGWSEEHFCAWRKSIQGPTLRGPIEFSAQPVFDSTVDPDAPAVCVFSDGCRYEASHITMVPRMVFVCFQFQFL